MKTYLKYIGFALVAISLASCKLDNYTQPNASLYGSVIDDETGELILQDLNQSQGSSIEIVEDYWVNGEQKTQARTLNFKTDGTYCEKNMFNGTYTLRATRTNFYPVEDVIEVHGDTEYILHTTPYARLLDPQIEFVDTKGMVVATCRVKSDEKIKNVRLFCSENPNVSLGINEAGDNACQVGVNGYLGEDQVITLKMDTQYMTSGKDFYFRLGALVDVNEARYNYSPAVRLHIDNSNIEPVVEEPLGISIDDCESADGWSSGVGSVSTDGDCREGMSSIAVTGSSKGVVLFQKVFSEPIDTKVTVASGILKLWIYVSDASVFPATSAGQLEITSGGTCDSQEINWTFDKLNLNTGWNELNLKLSDGANSGIDLSAVNYIRFYHAAPTGGDVTVKLDDIRIYAPEVFDECDSADGWGSGLGDVTVDAVDKRDGEGSIAVTGNSGGVVFFQKVFDEPFAAPCTLEKGHFTCYIYVSDADILAKNTAGQFEITSGGACDSEEINFTYDQLNLSTGWNAIDLPLSQAHKNGDVNLDALNYIRMYHTDTKKQDITIKLDRIAFYEGD